MERGVGCTMTGCRNIFLIGPMGAGKTTIGRQLAKLLGYRFEDSDRVIERRTGVQIPVIFEIEGEAGFRLREKQVIDDLTAEQGIVLATGGGAILDAGNRALLVQRGFVVYLSADVALLVERTSRDNKRPLLQTANPEQRIREILLQRDPLYREVADLTVDTSSRPVRKVVQDIAQQIEASCGIRRKDQVQTG